MHKWPNTGALLLVSQSVEITRELAIQHASDELARTHTPSRGIFAAGAHPDFRLLEPEGKSNSIKIDQIRELIDWSYAKPQLSEQKIAIISPADRLNLQAANALLKILEDHPVVLQFILITTKVQQVPITIRSRCHWVRDRALISVENEVLQTQIKQDLKALRNETLDPIGLGTQWLKQDPKIVLAQLWLVLSEQTLLSAKRNRLATNPRWWRYLDQILHGVQELEAPNPPNVQLLLESILLEYVSAIQTS